MIIENEEYSEIIDCFCGSPSVAIQFRKKSNKPVLASDHLECLITTLKAVQNGYVPPTNVSQEEFDELKQQDDNPLKTFVHLNSGLSGRLLRHGFSDRPPVLFQNR